MASLNDLNDPQIIATQEQEPVSPAKWNTKFEMGEDKLGHFGVGLSGSAALYLVGLPLWISVTLIIALLFFKEVWDSMGNGFADWWDFICGVM